MLLAELSFTKILPWLSSIDTLLSLLAFVSASVAWFKTTEILRTNREARERRAAPVSIIAVDEASNPPRRLTFPYRPRRDQLSRAELMGIIGVYSGERRYDPSRISAVLETGDLDRVLTGEQDEIRIPCSPAEFDAFHDLIAAGKAGKAPSAP